MLALTKLHFNLVAFCRFPSLFTFQVYAFDLFYRFSFQWHPGEADSFLFQKPHVLPGKIYLVHQNQLRILPGQLPEAFNLCLEILYLIEGIPVKMIYPA
jgi:hypothetical protein